VKFIDAENEICNRARTFKRVMLHHGIMHCSTKRTMKGMLTAQQVHRLLCRYGKPAFKVAQKIILEEDIENRNVREALDYFVKEVWLDMEYPGLMALACKAVKGKPDKTLQIGASLVLLRGAMDVHDDIIDKQGTKAGKPTLYGKYGQDMAILAGDVLFYEGLMHLNKAILHFRREKRQEIADMVKEALFEVGTGVASEVDYRGNFNLPPEDLMRIVTQKSACLEMHARIGAIVGGGGKAEEDALGIFGRLLGVLTMIRDEFIDIYEPEELKNRQEKECLPLPLLFAFKDVDVKKEISPILEKRKLLGSDSQRIVNIVLRSEGIKELKKQMDDLKKTALSSLKVLEEKKTVQSLYNLLGPLYEDIKIG
jgi:geranylgeranyl pyrophosphate synthase